MVTILLLTSTWENPILRIWLHKQIDVQMSEIRYVRHPLVLERESASLSKSQILKAMYSISSTLLHVNRNLITSFSY